MKLNSSIFRILLSIIPLFFIILNLLDLYEVYFGKGGYPFESEFFSKNSIYQSKNFYTGFALLFTLFLLVTLFLIWKQRWRWIILIAIIDLLFILYPFIFNWVTILSGIAFYLKNLPITGNLWKSFFSIFKTKMIKESSRTVANPRFTQIPKPAFKNNKWAKYISTTITIYANNFFQA